MGTRSSGAELLSATELDALLRRGGCVVVDCRFNLLKPGAGETAYRVGHIPGAVYADLDQQLSGPRTCASGRHPLPYPGTLGELFSTWGIGPGTRVVVYDDQSGAIAARLWWLLRWMGHQEVALLDGGLQAWEAAGFGLTDRISVPERAEFPGVSGQMPVIGTDAVLRLLGDPHFRLLDARAPERYLGQVEPIDTVAGHVPGAVNHAFALNLRADGTFKSPEELRGLYESSVGAGGPRTAIMCGSGVTACHDIFAMARAGLGTASLYEGSWSEWIRSPERPVATVAGNGT